MAISVRLALDCQLELSLAKTVMRTEIVNIEEEEQQTFTTETRTASRDIREQIIATIT